MAAQYDIDLYQGADFAIQFALKDALYEPLDLSAATVASQIRSLAGELLATFTTVSFSALGLVTLSLSRDQTSNTPVGRHKYDVLLRLNGIDEVIVEGRVVVRPVITVIV
jgi:hypothetical protein